MAGWAAAVALAGCATPDSAAPPDPYRKLHGQEIYAVVTGKSKVPAADILLSEPCAQADAACQQALRAAARMELASVAVYDALTYGNVLVPRSAKVEPGDIVKIRVSADGKRVPIYVEHGARRRARTAAACDWVDGKLEERQGGVACKGWRHQSVR